MKLPKSAYNWTTVSGAVISLIALFMIGFLLTISFFFNRGGSYLGLFIYMVLPTFLVFGLLLIPIGMWRQHKRSKKSEEKREFKWPKIDFNDHRNRNALMIFFVGSTIFLLVSSVGTYEAFHYTESNKFCGTLCHEVMEPEYVAYQNSSHARVKCVECHVGPGADWYVKSKLSGLYQVYAVTTGNFPRPIPTPLENLRPARETCEQCHWPEKFYDRKNRTYKHYLADEENTEWDINLQVLTGPTYSALGQQEGIHWHINPDVKIEYKTDSDTKESIPWVRYTNLNTGEEYIYLDENNPLDQEALDMLETRTMDCMDCHNRPSHNYLPPANFVDHSLTSGQLPKDLPELKMMAMDLLNRDYPTKDSAFKVIAEELHAYYSESYPELYANKKSDVEKAISGLQDGFGKNVFPAMKVKWNVYPNHLGHKETLGCNRCHDDKHISSANRSISRDCNLCHVIKAQGKPGEMEFGSYIESLEFKHPVDIDQEWRETACAECHSALY